MEKDVIEIIEVRRIKMAWACKKDGNRIQKLIMQ